MGNLKNRIRFSSTIDKDKFEWLVNYSNSSMIPQSKLLDVAIELLRKEVESKSLQNK